MITKITKILAVVALCFTVNNISAQEVYWGDVSGEGDFAGGLNGWTINNIEGDFGWQWNATGTLNNGGGITPEQGTSINSPTASNGAVTLNADAYTFPSGYVDPPFPVYISELISPDIDLSAVPVGTVLSLEFSQYASFFQAADGYLFTSFSVSNDGGMTWSNPIDCNPTIEQYSGNNQVPGTNNTLRLGIPIGANLAGSSSVKVKFTFAGTLIFWVIDDVKITQRDGNDLRVMTNWYAIAPNLRTPITQVETFGFLADVFNAGGNTATNAELQMEIVGGTSTHNESISYGDMVSDSLYENVSWGAYAPDQLGNYTGTYTMVSDSVDVNPDDNSISYSFSVTDSTFSKEAGPTRDVLPADENWQDNELNSWAYGNHYHIVNGADYLATSAGVLITAGTGNTVAINLYEWSDDNEDGIADPPSSGERTRVGFAFLELTAANTNGSLTVVSLRDIITNEPGVSLKDSTDYLIMVEYTDSGDGNAFALGASEAFDYGAAILNSIQQDKPRYAGMLGIAGDLGNEGFSSGGFGTDIVPVVRLHVNPVPVINTNDLLSEDNLLEVAPNPASEMINVNIDLVESHTDAVLNVYDATGKVIESRTYNQLQKEQLMLDVSNWTPGSYFLHLTTADGTKSHHFIVQH